MIGEPDRDRFLVIAMPFGNSETPFDCLFPVAGLFLTVSWLEGGSDADIAIFAFAFESCIPLGILVLGDSSSLSSVAPFAEVAGVALTCDEEIGGSCEG